MLLNMDGFDDDTTGPVFYSATDSWSTAFTASPAGAFSPTASDPVAVNPTRADFHSNDRTLSTDDPSRSGEDTAWRMYVSDSLSDSINSLDLDILDPDSLHLVYPLEHHELANEPFTELDSLGGYQDTTQTIDDIQQTYCITPLLAPQPSSSIQPAFLSLMSTQDAENPLLLTEGDKSTKADEHIVYNSSMLDLNALSAPTSDTFSAQSAPSSPLLPPSSGGSPTITKLVTHFPTRPRRGLTGWNASLVQSNPPPPLLPLSRGRSPTVTELVNQPSTHPSRGLRGWRGTNCLEPPAVPSSMRLHRSTSKSTDSLTVPDSHSPPLSSSTGGSSRNSERLLKRLRQSDESPPIIKRPPKTRRLMVADIDSDGVGADNGGDSEYTPSRSPSLDPSRSMSPSSHSPSQSVTFTSVKKKTKKSKGKAKGSAALALAVVSEMVRNPSVGPRDVDLSSARHASGITRRKNHPIPLPIPVPNLNKKSRGRKVPHIKNDIVTNRNLLARVAIKKEEDVDDCESEVEDESASSTRSRRKHTPSKSPSDENRTFICDIPGCGKCFVRSEHLKRHIRSIHTHDKRES